MPSEVFKAVAAESSRRKGYSGDLHLAVDDLVQEWLDGDRNGRRVIASGTTEQNFTDDVEECTAFVKAKYKAAYGNPIFVFLMWPFIGGLISWLVQRTLDRMFPNSDGTRRAV